MTRVCVFAGEQARAAAGGRGRAAQDQAAGGAEVRAAEAAVPLAYIS